MLSSPKKLEAPHEHLSTHKASQSPQQHDKPEICRREPGLRTRQEGLSSDALTEALISVPLLKIPQLLENTNLVISFPCSDLPIISESALDLKNSLTCGRKDFHSRVYVSLT